MKAPNGLSPNPVESPRIDSVFCLEAMYAPNQHVYVDGTGLVDLTIRTWGHAIHGQAHMIIPQHVCCRCWECFTWPHHLNNPAIPDLKGPHGGDLQTMAPSPRSKLQEPLQAMGDDPRRSVRSLHRSVSRGARSSSVVFRKPPTKITLALSFGFFFACQPADLVGPLYKVKGFLSQACALCQLLNKYVI